MKEVYYRVTDKIIEFKKETGKEPDRILLNKDTYSEFANDTAYFNNGKSIIFNKFRYIPISLSRNVEDIEVIGDVEAELKRGIYE